jgi:mRNA-degrading endonuclease toxin of MazEF toxin-antitoxin module
MSPVRPKMARGQVWYIDFPWPLDRNRTPPIQKYGLLLQAGPYWRHFPSLLVALITSQSPIAPYPHMVAVPAGEAGLPANSWVDCGDLYRLNKDPYITGAAFVGDLARDYMDQVDDALQFGTGIMDGADYLKT